MSHLRQRQTWHQILHEDTVHEIVYPPHVTPLNEEELIMRGWPAGAGGLEAGGIWRRGISRRHAVGRVAAGAVHEPAGGGALGRAAKRQGGFVGSGRHFFLTVGAGADRPISGVFRGTAVGRHHR